MSTPIAGVCVDIDGQWWNGHGPGSGCRHCDSDTPRPPMTQSDPVPLTARPLTNRELAEERDRHSAQPQCRTCMQPQPCRPARLLATIAAARTQHPGQPVLSGLAEMVVAVAPPPDVLMDDRVAGWFGPILDAARRIVATHQHREGYAFDSLCATCLATVPAAEPPDHDFLFGPMVDGVILCSLCSTPEDKHGRAVPVAEERLRTTVKAVVRSMTEWLASSDDGTPEDRAAIAQWRNALQSALAATVPVAEPPKDWHEEARERWLRGVPPPVDPDEWTALANDIRVVDGNHDLGAGALAERLIQRGWGRAVPVAEEKREVESGERLAAIIEEADTTNPEWARGARFVLGWVSGPGFAALDQAFQAVRDQLASSSDTDTPKPEPDR